MLWHGSRAAAHVSIPLDLPTRLMAGTGHWLMMDRPEAFNHIVDE
jgi:pimeloyl-ACP methyl ester carboxylesterase